MLFEKSVSFRTCETCGWGLCVDAANEDTSIYKSRTCPYCHMSTRRVMGSKGDPDPDDRFYARSQIRDPSNRRYIPPRVRKAVLEKYDSTCAYCGSREKPTIDHIVSLIDGGTNDIDNLQVLCHGCNASKREGDGANTRAAVEAWREFMRPIKQSLVGYVPRRKRLSMAEIARVSGVPYATVLAYQDAIRKELGLS